MICKISVKHALQINAIGVLHIDVYATCIIAMSLNNYEFAFSSAGRAAIVIVCPRFDS